MVQPLFSRDEMEALRADMEPVGEHAETVDLVGGDHSFRKNVPALERRLDLFVPPAQRVISRTLRENRPTQVEPVEVVGPRAAIDSLQSLALACELHAPGAGLVGFVGLDSELAFRLIERAFGAQVPPGDEELPPVPDRTRLTAVEHATLMPILKAVAAELTHALFEDADVELEVTPVPTGLPPDIPGRVDTTLLWRMVMDFGSDRRGNLVLVGLPSVVMLVARRGAVAEAATQPTWMPAHLGQTRVEVSAQLGEITMTVSELLALRPGDLLRLNRGREESVDVLVEGVPKMTGHPVHHNGVFGVELGDDPPGR